MNQNIQQNDLDKEKGKKIKKNKQTKEYVVLNKMIRMKFREQEREGISWSASTKTWSTTNNILIWKKLWWNRQQKKIRKE